MKKEKLKFLKPREGNSMGQWLVEQGISAGFPSPADDFKEVRISLDKELVRNKESTFYARVSGDSMLNAGLSDGDLIIIDRSLNPENGKIAVCFLDGEFTIKRVVKENSEIYLKPENKNYKKIKIDIESEFIVWGIVTYVIKKTV
jgi:DNA polymerase V